MNKKELVKWLELVKQFAEDDAPIDIAYFGETKNKEFLLCAGWVDGFYPDDDAVIPSKKSPTFGMCIKIATNELNGIYDCYDTMNMPLTPEGDVDDTEYTLSPDDNIDSLADWLIKEYKRIENTYGGTI